MLEQVRDNQVDPEAALEELRKLPFEDLGYAKIDNHRGIRKGVPEVIFCQGKSIEQIQGIVTRITQHHHNILATRATREVADGIEKVLKDSEYHEMARIVVLKPRPVEKVGNLAVVSAGTSDILVAEEAAVTAEALGNHVNRIYDVGVAGIHVCWRPAKSFIKPTWRSWSRAWRAPPGQCGRWPGFMSDHRCSHQRRLRYQFRRYIRASNHVE